MQNPVQRKQAVLRAKALTGKLKTLRQQLESRKLDEETLARIKAEIVEIGKRLSELGID